MLQFLCMEVMVPFCLLDERQGFRKLLPEKDFVPTNDDRGIAKRDFLDYLGGCQYIHNRWYSSAHPCSSEPRTVDQGDEPEPIAIGQIRPVLVLSADGIVEGSVGYKQPITFRYGGDLVDDFKSICSEIVFSTEPYYNAASFVEDVGHSSYLRISLQDILLIHTDGIDPVVSRNLGHQRHVQGVAKHTKSVSKVACDLHQTIIADDMVSTRSTDHICIVFQARDPPISVVSDALRDSLSGRR